MFEYSDDFYSTPHRVFDDVERRIATLEEEGTGHGAVDGAYVAACEAAHGNSARSIYDVEFHMMETWKAFPEVWP